MRAGIPSIAPKAGRPWKDGFCSAWHAATEAAGCPREDRPRLPPDGCTQPRAARRAGEDRDAGHRHKTRSIFDYNIVVEKDIAEALGKLSTQPPVEEQKRKGQVKQFRRGTVKEQLKSAAKSA